MKIAIITCYRQPDYIRAQTLRGAAGAYPGATTYIIKNKQKNLLRYIEVIAKVISTRLTRRPDVYILTFRGYEVLPILSVLTWPQSLIYDELVNPLEWLQEPRSERWARLIPQRLLRWFYRLLLRRCNVVLADTDEHAHASAQLSGVNPLKYKTLPVGTNEMLFKPLLHPPATKSFQVFYYGSMLPLHGLRYVLAAAENLTHRRDISFLLVGGGDSAARKVAAAKARGAQSTYKSWIDFSDLPQTIYKSALCLAGPFGNTTQAQQVITGKTYQFLACGALAVVGQNQATKRYFEDKKNSLVVPQGDAAALAAAIEWAADHQTELTPIRQAGRALYERQFSSRVIADQLAIVLDELAEHP